MRGNWETNLITYAAKIICYFHDHSEPVYDFLPFSEKVAFNPLLLWLFCGINVASQFQVVGVHFECIICRLFSDTSLRDGLFHEYKKFGKVMSVSIKGEKEDRFAIVTFKKYDVTLCHMNDFYGPTVLSIQLAFTTSHFQG